MLSRLILQLDTAELNYFKGSALQGVLFERMDPTYAGWLHQKQIHPYSQYLRKTKQGCEWVVQTLTEDADTHIIGPLLEPDVQNIYIRNGEISVRIISRRVERKDPGQMKQQIQSRRPKNVFEVEVVTPAAFKHAGGYALFPDPGMVFRSLVSRYQPLEEMDPEEWKDILEELTEESRISAYQLRTVKFPLEKVTIPGFIGRFSLDVRGSDRTKQMAEFLLRFGSFSGIGIKTGMGMGAVRLK